VVREEHDGQLTPLAYGVILTSKDDTLAQRLQLLRNELRALVNEWRPDCCAVEELFFAANAKTGIVVGQARGVILLTLADAGLHINEYTPLQVKQSISGYGQAEKKQMQEMVRMLLKMRSIPKPDDAADALAIAITHLHSYRRLAL
jgi:crossover junction endodeoxyribonuclease RuvC